MLKNIHTVLLNLGLVALFLCPTSSSASTTDPRTLLKRVQEKLKSAKSISYDIHYRFKYFDHDDTAVFYAHVDILREPKDTLAGCYLLVQLKSNFIKFYQTKFYDTKNLYFILPKDTSIEVVDVHNIRWNITSGNTADGVICQSFLDPSKLDFDPTGEFADLGDSIIGQGLTLNILTFKMNDENGFEFFPSYRAIDPSSNFIVYSRDIVKWQGKYQYREATYSNVQFDKVDTDYFQNFVMPKGYRMWNYEPRKPLNQKPLVNDTLAPDFIAKLYPDTNKTMKLSMYRGKIVILDFWYMSCYPCVQALPALEEINKNYAQKGVVILGVNSTDLRVNHVHKMPAFFKQNPITYFTIMPDRSVDDDYHVHGYPTIYIIDRTGRIAFSQEGYSSIAEKIITDKLDEMLK